MRIGAVVFLSVALAFAFLSLGASAASASDDLADVVERAVIPLLERHGAPGLAVAVTVDGEKRFFNFGVASRETGNAVDQNTIFELGSVSKTFTATLGCYGVALGKLTLADRPSRHMPELAGSAVDKANLLELGAHAAGGLPLQFPDEVRSDEALTAYFRAWRPDAAPGEIRRYSNPSIGLFGRLAARAMGGRFADVLEREIIPKFGLTRTFVRVPSEAMADYAWGDDGAGKPVRVNPGPLAAEAYGVKSTASDMIRFVEANMRPETLDPAMQRAVECAQTGYFRAGPMVQGLGWERIAYPAPLRRLLDANSREMIMEARPIIRLEPPDSDAEAVLFDKTGSTGGFGAYVAFVPDRRIGLVMLANRNVPVPARITAAHAVLEALAALREAQVLKR